jgi:hypothetical protein
MRLLHTFEKLAVSRRDALPRHPECSDHKGAQRALEQVVATERAKLVSAHAVQRCLYEVLLYAEGEDALVYAEVAHVVATLMEDAVDKLDSVRLRRAVAEAESGESVEQDP